jgi:hypothetical protein
VLAGLLIGCLTLKPQLGLLIPVVLIASRQWTVIAAATVSALVVAGLPTLYFGTDYWAELARVGSAHFEFMKEKAWEFHLMPSVYAELRKLGLSHAVGIGVQWTVAAGAGLVLGRAWSDPETSFDLRAAVLVSAIPLSTPYLWYYDAAFTALTALFLLRAGVLQFSLPQFPVLALLWVGAGASCVIELMTPETVVPIRELTLPVMFLGFILAARAAAGGRSLAPQPA